MVLFLKSVKKEVWQPTWVFFKVNNYFTEQRAQTLYYMNRDHFRLYWNKLIKGKWDGPENYDASSIRWERKNKWTTKIYL